MVSKDFKRDELSRLPLKVVYEGEGKLLVNDEYISIPVEIHILKPRFGIFDVSNLSEKEIQEALNKIEVD